MTAEQLFQNGMQHFDANRYPLARAHFKAVIDRFPAAAEDARYFYAITGVDPRGTARQPHQRSTYSATR